VSNSQRKKGKAGELEIARLLRDHLGADITRNLLQARQGGADLLGVPGWAIEVKRAARAVLAGEPWHVTGAAALRQADKVREAHYDEDLWTDEAMGIVASMDEGGSTVTIPDILDRMDIPRAQQTTATQRRVANILKTNGYKEARKWVDGKTRYLRIWKK